MRKFLKTAVIGAGKMGSYHANILRELDKVELCALVTKTKESSRLKAKKYKIPVYTSLEELFAKHKLDFVVISSPTIYHKAHTIKALENGCHILLEKPIALSSSETEEIIKAENRSGKKVMVGHIERFNPIVLRAKELLNKKELGKILLYDAVRVGKLPDDPSSDVLLDLGIHDFDLFNFLVNERFKKINCSMYRKLNRKYNDFAYVNGESISGIVFNYQTDWLRKSNKRETKIVGEKGELNLDFLNNELTILNDKHPKGKTIQVEKNVNKLEEEIKAFIKCIIKDEKVPISTKESLVALSIYESCIRCSSLD